MVAFVVTAIVMLGAMVPIGLVVWRGAIMEALVAYEAATSVLVMVLILLPEGFQRSGLFEFPVLMAVLMLGGGLVFVHLLERWL